MKKRIITTLTALAILAAFASISGCSTQDNDSSATVAAVTAEPAAQTPEEQEPEEEALLTVFETSTTDDNKTYTIDVNGRSIYQNSSGIYVDGKKIDSNAYPIFISDGYTLYYCNNGNVFCVDLDTFEKELVLYDEEAYLEGCYNNQYLYYTTGKYNSDEIETDLAVYDLNSGEVLNVISNVGNAVVGENHIFARSQTGDMSAVSIRQADLNGDNCKEIIDNASPSAMKVIDGELYYGAMIYYSGYQYELQIQSYNENSGETTVLTDAYDGDLYVDEITSTYASLTNGVGEPFVVNYK